jgi:dethiobiotin synthetase
MKTKPLFVTGIGTYVGKTIVSAVLCEQLKLDYWKPVQSGDLDETDSDKVARLISNPITVIYPERHLLAMAASPHKSAKAEDIEIKPTDFIMPETDNQLLIEGAGGLFVPLSGDFMMIDLIQQVDAEAVLVVRNYLGCINHTLLSIYTLVSKNIPLKHVVFNGNFDDDTLDLLLAKLPADTTWSILPEFRTLNNITISLAPTQFPERY